MAEVFFFLSFFLPAILCELGRQQGGVGSGIGSSVLEWGCLQGSGRRLKGLGVGCPRGRARTKCDLSDFQAGIFNYEGKLGSS